MATEANGAPPPAPGESPAPAASTTAPAPAATEAASANQPKLSNAELKAKQKAEKAARRAAQKEAKVAVAPPAAAGAQQDGNKGGKQPSKGGKQDSSNQEQQSTAQRPGQPPRRPSMASKRPSLLAGGEQDLRAAIPECFSHIPMAKRIPTSQAHKDVHSAVLVLGQQMATFTVRDSITRLKYMLLAFRKVGSRAASPAKRIYANTKNR
jgi:translation initiation factor eIF-2B subunit delta